MDLYVLNWAAMQAISAVEARLTFPGDAVLIAEPALRSMHVVDRVEWHRTHWIDIRTRDARLQRLAHWQRFRLAIDAALVGVGSIDRIFVGHLGAPMCHAINVSRAREVVVLDAGLLTPAVARARASHRVPNLRQTLAAGGRRLMGIRTRPPSCVTFFSAYHLDVRSPDKAVRHRFEHLRALSLRTSRSDEAWFIGQNFVEGEMMTAARYEAFIAEGIAGLGRVRYFAHPRESEARLNQLARRFDIEVTRFSSPLEIEMLERAWPRTIVGVSSAALHSAALIAGNSVNVRALRAGERDLLRFNAGMADVYDQFASVGVDIIEGAP